MKPHERILKLSLLYPTAASDTDRQERLKKAVEPELQQLAQGLLKQEDKIEALGFRLTHGGGSLLLSYQGSQLALVIRPYGARRDVEGRVYGANGNWSGEDDYRLFYGLNAKARTMAATVPGVLRFLRTHQNTFKKLYDSDETIPEISSERTASASIRTAVSVSSKARKARLLKGLHWASEIELMTGLLRVEDKIRALGFDLQNRDGRVCLGYKGSRLALCFHRKGGGTLDGSLIGVDENHLSPSALQACFYLRSQAAKVQPKSTDVLRFLVDSRDGFAAVFDEDETIPEISSEE